MGPLPDLSGLVFFAIFGWICATLLAIGAVGFVGWHLFWALKLYLGGM